MIKKAHRGFLFSFLFFAIILFSEKSFGQQNISIDSAQKDPRHDFSISDSIIDDALININDKGKYFEEKKKKNEKNKKDVKSNVAADIPKQK